MINDLCLLYTLFSTDLLREDQKNENTVKQLFAHMEQRGERWLYVYDNIQDYDTLRGLLPPGHLIVTTRQSQGWGEFKVLHTDALPFRELDDPAVEVLLETAERDSDREGARALAAALGGSPLALVIVGSLLRRHRDRSFDYYTTALDEVLVEEDAYPEYLQSLKASVQLSYDDISDDPQIQTDAQMVADLFAWLAPEGLEAGLITDPPSDPSWGQFKGDIPEPLQDLAQAPSRVLKSVEALEDRSLIRRVGSSFAMHRMTAAALRAMQSERLLNEAAAALLAAVYPGGDGYQNPGFSGNWPLCRRLTPHVRALWASGNAPVNAAMEYLLNQAGIFLGKIGDNSGEIDLKRASLDLKSARLPENDRDIAVGHANLGLALQRAGDLEAAELECRRAVELGVQYHAGTIDLADWRDLLGGLLLVKGRAGEPDALTESLREYQRSAAILRRHVPRLSDARAQVLNNLGTVRDELGQLPAALRLGEYSLNIWREVLPEGDARRGYALLNVGAMALKAGAADRAEPLLEEALALWQAVYLEAPKHPEIVNVAGWLISTYLTRARAGEDAQARKVKAMQLCDEFGFDYDQRVEHAKRYPYAP
ncbi:putative ATP/GTP binding protein [Candidatus Rhodobacter oscarellae]|uniref:Putative ATP/GTP binding protein n=1 Tax=Candidatus Rhodobacter oscarellae TaxID=1675527 RepID=A0A0J9E714_9RHOB|nr:putative ATP/GTP binding protein [Candidatus Rhodobacter lobularis]